MEMELKTCCAWCDQTQYAYPVSHGICDKHYNQMLAELKKKQARQVGSQSNRVTRTQHIVVRESTWVH